MFYTYKNCKILLNGNPLLVNNATLALQANVVPAYLVGKNVPEGYAATEGIVGSLRLNYFLTGKDFVKDYLQNESGYLTGNFGGLIFNSGKIRSYSFEGATMLPVQVDSEITFYGQLTGSFNPTTDKTNRIVPLNFANAIISGEDIGNVSLATRISFNASAEIEPVYRVTSDSQHSYYPQSIYVGPKQAQAEITFDNIDGSLALTGNHGSLTIEMANSSGVIQETFTVRGIVERKNFEVGANKLLTATYGIRQDTLLPDPIITGFSKFSAYPFERVSIYGVNFITTTHVYVGKSRLSASIISDSEVVFRVPFLTGGAVKVVTQGGVAESTAFSIREGGIVLT